MEEKTILNSTSIEEERLRRLPQSKIDELTLFLKEYYAFHKETFDFYYVIPFEWLLEWDNYITDPE